MNTLWIWRGRNSAPDPGEDPESTDRTGFFIDGIIWILVDLSGNRNAPLNNVRGVVGWAEAGRQDEFSVRDILGQDPFLG